MSKANSLNSDIGNIPFNPDTTVGAGQDGYVLVYRNATGQVDLEPLFYGAYLTVESPSDSEDISIFKAPADISITEMTAVVRGSTPSVTWTVRHSTDRSAAGNEVVTSGTTTTSASTGSVVTSFNDATIPDGSFVWFETTATSGTIEEIHLTIEFTVD
jgi:hypothetical protein